MGVTADHFRRDRGNDIAEIEQVALLGHAGMKHDLKQQVAEFVFQIDHVAAGDGVGDFIGLFDGVGRNRSEILLDIPWASGFRRPQGDHDLEKAGNVARGLHRLTPGSGDWNRPML